MVDSRFARRAWLVAAAVAVAAIVVYQFLIRYQYEHLAGGRVVRFDRLTGLSCDVTSYPMNVPNPCTPPLDADRQRYAIGLAKPQANALPPTG